MTRLISIRGARTHNLKNISLDIPRDKLTVITGLSGSGKSSLAFDTLYAEGQRRYVESLSAYARQFLQLMEKPDVDSIDGLSPAISIEQKTTSKNPRSTVGTVTEIYDYLRLLFARIGIPHSPATGLPIKAQSVSQMVDKVLEFEKNSKWYLLAPIARAKKGEYKKEFLDIKKRGFQRVKIDGEIYEIDEIPELKKNIKHDISIVVDRWVIPLEVSFESRGRFSDSFQTALALGNGVVFVENASSGESIVFSSLFACPISGFQLTEVEPRIFSFNSPNGACQKCDGLGVEIIFDKDLVIPDGSKSLIDGAIAPFNETAKRSFIKEYYVQTYESLARHYNFSLNTPFSNLSDEVKNVILFGSGDVPIAFDFKDHARSWNTFKPFEGVLALLKRRLQESENESVKENLRSYQRENVCEKCNGKRLRFESLCVKINAMDISQVCEMSIKDAKEWFLNLKLSDQEAKIAERILKEINDRLHFLNNVGLDYLTLSRSSGTLSGGESQRIRLASQIGSGLSGVLYVLDEPSIGLHQKDNAKLLETLTYLRDLGNTVVVVEHDEDAIRLADHIIDMGPGAGRMGGEIVASGTIEEIIESKRSITGKYISREKIIEVPKKPRTSERNLTIKGATGNNLKNITVSFPLGCLTCVTGVSGSGKSTLVIDTLFKALHLNFFDSKDLPKPFEEITGLEFIDKVIEIDQSPIGRTPRSNPITYVGCFTAIREWFASLPLSKAKGFSPGRFSFNVKGGRCETCQGDGVIKIAMHFLPDVYVTCDQCHGKRYNRETLEVMFNGKNISDVLDMTVDEAVVFFAHHTSVVEKLRCLQSVGLGYLHLGQQATTLSGGEAQRIKLSKELSKRSTGQTIYILDEPTTGLHFEDVAKLLEVIQRLVDQGNTVVIIEHNLDVIKVSDWIIDIGPDGGEKGGNLVFQGTLKNILKCKESYTGKYLKQII